MDAQLVRYFKTKYPSRNHWLGLFGFRGAEDERFRILSRLFPSLPGNTLCDLGCGDCWLLSKLLEKKGTPDRITVIDISPQAIALAKENLKHFENILDADISDFLHGEVRGVFDVVMVIGVSDYYDDLDLFLRTILKKTSKTLIVDFSRSWKIRNIFRRIWLGWQGIKLHTFSRRRILSFLESFFHAYRIEETKYNWMVKAETEHLRTSHSREGEMSKSGGYGLS